MENKNQKNDKRKGRVLIALGVALLMLCGVGGYAFLHNDSGSGGTSIGSYEGKTKEEIQTELDKQVLESMMTISLDVTPTLSKDGTKLNVRVDNVKDNKFEQMVTVEQNGKVIGSYKGLKPGETLDYLDVKNCTVGKATVTIQKMDSESGKPSGNASGFEVEIVQ